ncbi:hypothetical protein BDZ89DRAFT_186867 [Hymenopellis radicata]|nr:hypothetical protein BDZ89DRAFT_186867 [Hymenopellis radicata]
MIPATSARRTSDRRHNTSCKTAALAGSCTSVLAAKLTSFLSKTSIYHLEKVFSVGRSLAIKNRAGSVARSWREVGGVTLRLLWKVMKRYSCGVAANTSASSSLDDAMIVNSS